MLCVTVLYKLVTKCSKLLIQIDNTSGSNIVF